MEPSFEGLLSFAQIETAYAAVTTNIDMTTSQNAIAVALTAKTLSKPQKRALMVWLVLNAVGSTQKNAGLFKATLYANHAGLLRLDPSLSILTHAEREAAYAAISNLLPDSLYTAINATISPYTLSKGQGRCLVAWWILHNINGA